MMHLKFHNQLLLRLPRYPVSKAGRSLEDLLNDPAFRDALYLSSGALWTELTRVDFRLSEKMRLTLTKYQKRMSYRPTPFGGLAGIGVLPFVEGNESHILINGDFKTLLFSKRQQFEGSSGGASDERYRFNTMLYSYGTDFRLIHKEAGEKDNLYSISELFGSELLADLSKMRGSISRQQINALLESKGLSPNDLQAYLGELLDLQILLPHEVVPRLFPIRLTDAHKKEAGSTHDSYSHFSASGMMPQGLKLQQQEALCCMEKLSHMRHDTALTSFKSRFAKLFDRREMPLLQALDPETGIDYEQLGGAALSPGDARTDGQIAWTALHEMLLSKWIQQERGSIAEVNILDQDLAALDVQDANYPPGMSILFSVLDEKIHIKAAGGCSALNLIGRFTRFDPQVFQLARELARLEMVANPEVIFAELSHTDHARVASVTAKALVYDYEIPFFDPPALDGDRIISLNDLYISLVDNQLVLRSSRLNKRVIPRFSSAYNYHNSTLPVFRFLCELQHDGLRSNLNFSMAALFPGLPAYPRVTYKNAVLEAASWHVDSKQLVKLKRMDVDSQLIAFRAFALQIYLPDEFCYEIHDQLLHMCLTSDPDILMLLNTCPASGTVVLREYFHSQENLVRDSDGNAYAHECIAFLTNSKASYISPVSLTRSQVVTQSPKFFPLNDWLYIRIYLHPAGASDLLLQFIRPFIETNKAGAYISTWFFISYFDDDFHLRIRLKLVPGKEPGVIETYRQLEQELRPLPNINRVELATYFPENERYSLIGIEHATQLFCLSSELVLANLSVKLGTEHHVQHRQFRAIRFLLNSCNSLGLDDSTLESLCLQHLTKSQKIQFDDEFRGLKGELLAFLSTSAQSETDAERLYFSRLRDSTRSLILNEKLSVLTDLNHMHLNRHFLQNQLEEERKSYYWLGKIVPYWKGILKVLAVNDPMTVVFCDQKAE